MRAEAVDPLSVQSDAPVRRAVEPDDHLEKRALTGPVRTDDGDDVAVVDPECHPVDGRETAEALRYVVDFDEQIVLRGYDGGR
jgi:hypothetical protein